MVAHTVKPAIAKHVESGRVRSSRRPDGKVRVGKGKRAPGSVEADDIQGLVFRGYGDLPWASYHLLSVQDAAKARAWIGRIIPSVSRGEAGSRTEALQLAFTHPGLSALGLPDATLQGFSREFLSGMVTENRSRFLGDEGESAPQHWAWGGPNTGAVHGVLMLYARSAAELAVQQAARETEWSEGGWLEVKRLSASELSGTEHFGFTDGISQPAIQGYHDSDSRLHAVRPGEFVLGYINEYDSYTGRPLVAAEDDPQQVLAPDVESSARHDFGRNGSYAVFRQLRQNVPLFRAVLEELTRRADGTADRQARERLAAKMVGRWPSGASLVESPKYDAPDKAGSNEFGYHTQDPDGLKCPIGSHVRRTNPRDSLDPEPGSDRSLAVNKRHRILRRGRAYGPKLPAGSVDTADRGLFFVAINANIQRQFEFIQHTWINSPHFAGLYNDSDPIVGPRSGNDFTIPSNPVRRQCSGLPRFVTVTGGAYFFLPSIRALRYLVF